MKKGTKIGWLLIAISIVFSLWVVVSQSSKATKLDNGFVVDDANPNVMTGYTGDKDTLTADDFPASIDTIDSYAFKNSGVSSISLPDTVTTLRPSAFADDEILESVTTNKVATIPNNAFNQCAALSSFTVDANVTNIGDDAFVGTTLTGIDIPANCQVTSKTFNGASQLAAISVNSSNPYNKSIDGCLYNAGGTILLKVPEGKPAESGSATSNFTVAFGATEIAADAFNGASNLKSVTLPSSVTKLDANAFDGSSITELYIYNKDLTTSDIENLPSGANIPTARQKQRFAANWERMEISGT